MEAFIVDCIIFGERTELIKIARNAESAAAMVHTEFPSGNVTIISSELADLSEED